jgi:hypothetical protein
MMLLDPDVQALAGNIGRNHSTSSGSEQRPDVHAAAARKYAITRLAERASCRRIIPEFAVPVAADPVIFRELSGPPKFPGNPCDHSPCSPTPV